MANNELPIRFTEEMYATKSEVSKELHMSLIDSIWSNILKYRSTYFRYLSLKSIEKNQLMVCYCQTVEANLNNMLNKINTLKLDYETLENDSGDLTHFEDLCTIRCLRHLSNKYNFDTSDIYLRSLIRGDVKDLSFDKRILKRYLESLKYIKAHHEGIINIDFLAGLYSVFTENPELTSFYREKEDRNPINRVLIDRIYTSAPVNVIDPLMNSLFTFIITSPLNAVTKSIITYYFINYVRPFPKENEEIALLMMKAVMANDTNSPFAVYLPLENLLNLNAEALSKVSVEVQKTNDLTYFVNYILKAMDQTILEVKNIKVSQDVDIAKRNLYQDEVVIEEQIPVQEEEKPVELVPEEKVEEIKPEPIVEPKPIEKEEEKPVIGPAPLKEEKVVATREIAFEYIPPVLDEKQASRLEAHLLEMDPALKRGEAKFYARHCTMHMYYTIEQYKKSIGCAYETARTSMEHLVELHYYRKEKVNNKKFVYTPIKK